MKKQKCRMLWSPPVQPHCQTSQGQAHQRGKASGVAAASAVPIRPIRNKLPDEWATTTRFVHGVLQLGQSHCQLLVLYCKPVSQTNAVEYSNQLLQLAIQQASLLPLPYMILLNPLNLGLCLNPRGLDLLISCTCGCTPLQCQTLVKGLLSLIMPLSVPC